MTSEKLEKLALEIIGIIDYDILKECQYTIEEEGEDDLVAEVADFLKEQFGGQDG